MVKKMERINRGSGQPVVGKIGVRLGRREDDITGGSYKKGSRREKMCEEMTIKEKEEEERWHIYWAAGVVE